MPWHFLVETFMTNLHCLTFVPFFENNSGGKKLEVVFNFFLFFCSVNKWIDLRENKNCLDNSNGYNYFRIDWLLIKLESTCEHKCYLISNSRVLILFWLTISDLELVIYLEIKARSLSRFSSVLFVCFVWLRTVNNNRNCFPYRSDSTCLEIWLTLILVILHVFDKIKYFLNS